MARLRPSAQDHQSLQISSNNPYDPPNYTPQKISFDPKTGKVIKNGVAQKNINEKLKKKSWLKTRAANLLSIITVIYALDLIYINFNLSEWQFILKNNIDFTMIFRITVFMQSLIRFVRCVYTNRPKNAEMPINNLDIIDSGSDIEDEKLTNTLTSRNIKKSLKKYIRYCPICKINIIEKDHHCWFLSTCIAKNDNHTDFYLWAVWTLIGLTYSIFAHTIQDVSSLGAENKLKYVQAILPIGMFSVLFQWMKITDFLKLLRFYCYLGATVFYAFITLNYYNDHKNKGNKFRIFDQEVPMILICIINPFMADEKSRLEQKRKRR